MIISENLPMPICNSDCIAAIKKTATIVTGLDESLRIHTGDRAIISLFSVLHKRAGRLVSDKTIRYGLNPLLRKFVCNLVMYFKDAGKLDDYTLTNIITALALADNYNTTTYGTIDYSTLIRRLNPIHPDSDDYFIIGREGRVDDPACPMKHTNSFFTELSWIPQERLCVYLGFYHTRQMDPSRGAPKIHVDDFHSLVPDEIKSKPELEEAFTDVCLSDGAWELYQKKLAA